MKRRADGYCLEVCEKFKGAKNVMGDRTHKERNSVFEFVRLLAMFMIVFEHAMLATSLHTENVLSAIDNISWFLEAFTICAVNLFFLLTGYFATDNHIDLKRIGKIWGKTIFYSVSIYLIAFACGRDSFSVKKFISYLCPVMFKKYWFMQVYIVLSLLSPYIIRMLNTLTKVEHQWLIGVLVLFFSLHQTFIPVGYTLDQTQGYGIIWATVMLIIGNYFKKYENEIFSRTRASILLLGYSIIAIAVFVSNYFIVKFDIAQGVTSRGNFYAYNSVTIFLESLFLFGFFVKLSYRGWTNKVVNWFAGSALAVYLISSHPELLYPLWTDIFKLRIEDTNIVLFITNAVIESMITLVLCILIDKFVDRLIGKLKSIFLMIRRA